MDAEESRGQVKNERIEELARDIIRAEVEPRVRSALSQVFKDAAHALDQEMLADAAQLLKRLNRGS